MLIHGVELTIRDLSTGQHQKWTVASAATALAWSPDGTRLAAAVQESVIVWDAAKGEESRTLQGHKGAVTCVTFTSDGARVAAGGAEKSIRVWNAADGSSAGVFTGHQDRVTGLIPLRDGGLVSGAGDGTVRIWSLTE